MTSKKEVGREFFVCFLNFEIQKSGWLCVLGFHGFDEFKVLLFPKSGSGVRFLRWRCFLEFFYQVSPFKNSSISTFN